MKENPYQSPTPTAVASIQKRRDESPSREIGAVVKYWSVFAATTVIVIWIALQILKWYLSQIVVPEALSQ